MLFRLLCDMYLSYCLGRGTRIGRESQAYAHAVLKFSRTHTHTHTGARVRTLNFFVQHNRAPNYKRSICYRVPASKLILKLSQAHVHTHAHQYKQT